MKLWVDDMRDAPDDSWTVVRKVEPAIRLLAMFNVQEVSIDHDIENRPDDETFKPVAYFIGEKFRRTRTTAEIVHGHEQAPRPKLRVHSDNPVGAKEIQAIFESYGLFAPWEPYTSQADFARKFGLD